MEQNSATDDQLEAAKKMLESSLKIVVLTGAGISTDSGLADF